ncbi:MAG TPA: hypothetical protein VGY76_00935 [Solirubrobacteraceae bacterium]|jgi:hypothetical protein|nr:hypothetical protein [Solirubrobacteraceae bacterium]
MVSGSGSRYTRAALAATVALLLLGTTGGSAWASSEERAGWELSATTFPTNLVNGIDEIQKIQTGGVPFTLTFQNDTTVSLAGASTAGEVQAALEALPEIGPGNVSVSEPRSGVFAVTLTGLLGNMRTSGLSAEGATVTTERKGASSGTINIDVFNIGAGASNGPITVTDTLPPGLKAKDAGQLIGSQGWGVDPNIRHGQWLCAGNGPGPAPSVAGATVVTCRNSPSGLRSIPGGGAMPESVAEFRTVPVDPRIGIAVEASGEEEGVTNRVSIAGGGAATSAATTDSVSVSSRPAAPGIVQWDAWASNADGTIAAQAGSHPYELTTVFTVATGVNAKKGGFVLGGEARDIAIKLPPGLVGNLRNMPQCSRTQFDETESEHSLCPPSTQVGTLGSVGLIVSPSGPIYNLAPRPGEAAEFGFEFGQVKVVIRFDVRSGGDYGITAHVSNLPPEEIVQGVATIWGVPAAKSHNLWRGPAEEECAQAQIENSPQTGIESYCTGPQRPIFTPILTLPVSCAAPGPFGISVLDSWQPPAFASQMTSPVHDSSDLPSGFTGCEDLTFGPSAVITPSTSWADSPSGLTAEVTPQLGGLEEVNGLGSSDIQSATVTLPPGLVVNPGQAAGLVACSRAQAALESLPGGEENDGPAACPGASKLGTVMVRSPLIEAAGEKQLEGSVYLLQSNPPELKLLAAASADGVNVKLQGTVHLNEQTGQVTATFAGTPQVPASLFKLTFSEGARAPLVTPARCGTETADAVFTSWSSPELPAFATTSAFTIAEGSGGGACPAGSLPFAPTITAGTVNDRAGQFAGFTMHLQRGDDQQRVEKLAITLPPGLAGMIANVPVCPEPQAAQGSCPAGSQIGHAVVTAGPGQDPLVIPQPGGPEVKVYLTGPYAGAPFGLSIVTPVVAGPFNLGSVVSRARIAVDPHTAQVTIATDPLPQILDGVPTDIRTIDVTVDRPGFTFNPTNCNALALSGAIGGAEGASAPVSVPFQVTNCAALAFKPSFTVSTQARTSKKNGASLDVKVAYPTGAYPVGRGQANIHSVAVTLPKQLPSRLTTIQQACPQATFAANPASCPAGSLIGTAAAKTPVLAGALTGPAYLVSHGGAAFPDLVIVLQGEGVTLDLVGSIDIKHGVTSSAFNGVPDAPISTFALSLPEGPHSALAAVLPAKAKGSLCATRLTMPTTLTAQDGAQIKQNTKIAVTGCAKAKKRAKHAKHHKQRR